MAEEDLGDRKALPPPGKLSRAGKTDGTNREEVTNLTPVALVLHKIADHRNGYKATGVHRHGLARP